MKCLILLLFLFSCNPPNEIHWQVKGTIINHDTISIKTFKDSSRIDTIRYVKHTYYEAKSPRTLHGKWYLITVIVIGLAAILLIKK